MSEDWDVDSYKTDFESEEHWELRKNFMLAHKDRLPEDEIVCLAQVFVNIEFLGCRYPDETMRKVAELAKGVVESFREKKKNCLKRTFVAASEAAASKVKGLNSGVSGRNFEIAKKMKIDDKNKHNNYKQKQHNKPSNFNNRSFYTKKRKKRNGVKKRINSSRDVHNVNIKKLDGPFADFVLFVCDDHPANLLDRNASLNKCKISWTYDATTTSTSMCSVYLNGNLVGTAEGNNKKISRELAAKKAIKELQNNCYTVKIKAQFASDSAITPAQLSYPVLEKTSIKCNIGAQIMKLMGWTGGGLGAKQEGIIYPISLLSYNGRSGLGSGKGNDPEFKKRAKSLIQKWIESNTDQDLVFTSEFSSAQRRTLHELANVFSLKSKSYGKGEDRHLVVSRPSSPWKIVEELMKVGGSTSKYELVVPDL